MTSNEHGFTLVELVSVLAVSGLFLALIMYFGISYWRYSTLLDADLSSFVSRLNSQDFVRESIGTSDGLISQNSIPDANANNPDPTAGSNYWVVQHAVPGTTTLGTSGTTPILYYRRFSVNTSNAIVMNGTQPYEDEYVLYVNSATKQLLLRTLANPSVTNNKVTTSCPATLATASCPADKVIMESLSTINMTYYSRSGNTIDYQSSTDPLTGAFTGPDFPAVEALQFTFHVSKKPLFQKTNATVNDTVVRIALRNI